MSQSLTVKSSRSPASLSSTLTVEISSPPGYGGATEAAEHWDRSGSSSQSSKSMPILSPVTVANVISFSFQSASVFEPIMLNLSPQISIPAIQADSSSFCAATPVTDTL